MNQTQWLPLGAIVRNGLVHPPFIKEYERKVAWAQSNASNCTLAFYNTGQSLFLERQRSPANTYYTEPWEWIRYRAHRTPTLITVNDQKIAGIWNNVVPFQHCRHNCYGVVEIMIGARWGGTQYILDRHCNIPPFCIQYIAVRNGHVKDSMLVFQPLPLALMRQW